MGNADQLAERLAHRARHAELLQRELHAALVQQPHDDALAVQHRDDRHADVDLAAVHLELDAAVLRQPLLGDVQPGHDLEPADDGGLKAVDFRRGGLGLEDAVDAIADLDSRGLRLDVDVAGPRVDGLEQDFVHQVNDRCFLHLGGDFAVLDLQAVDQLDLFLFALGQQTFDRLAADAKVSFDALGDGLARGEHRLDRAAQCGRRLVDGIQVQRVGGGHDHGAATSLDGKQPVTVNQLLRKQRQKREVDRGRLQVDEVEPRLDAHRPKNVGLGRQPQLDGDLVDPGAVGAGVDGARQVRLGEQTVFA